MEEKVMKVGREAPDVRAAVYVKLPQPETSEVQSSKAMGAGASDIV